MAGYIVTHADRATRVLRALTKAWAEMLKRREADAVTDLSRALDELESDMTFTRCHPDVLDLIAEACTRARKAFEERDGHLPAADRVVERVASLSLRALGRAR